MHKQTGHAMPWIVTGDIDGFFGLALDNLVQLLIIVSLCRGVLGFSDELVYGPALSRCSRMMLARLVGLPTK